MDNLRKHYRRYLITRLAEEDHIDYETAEDRIEFIEEKVKEFEEGSTEYESCTEMLHDLLPNHGVYWWIFFEYHAG